MNQVGSACVLRKLVDPAKEETSMNTAFAPLSKSAMFAVREQDGVLVLQLRGEMGSLGWQSRNEAQIFAAIEGVAAPRLVVDLSDVSYGGSELMAFLFRLRRRLRASGGRVVLAGAKGNVRVVLRIVRLDRILDIHESVEVAVAALNDGEAYEISNASPA
jgi:stage II sporulation protein AA (anti-sigma F factor antagonist)